MFTNLSNKLVTYIFEFLDINDCSSVSCVSKQFFYIINDHNKFWTRECFRQYICFDLEPYSEIYDNGTYKTSIQQKNFALPKGAWKKLLEEGSRHRKYFGAILKQITAKDKVEAFLGYFDEILKQPPLPMATLKRETIIHNTQTLFQTKLSEVLYEDSTCISRNRMLIDEFKGLIDELKTYEKEMLQQTLFTEKNEVLRARWYLFEGKDTDSEETLSNGDRNDMIPELPSLSKLQAFESNATTDDGISLKPKNCLLLRLYDSLHNVLSHYCSVISEYLDSVENVYDLLAEYTARWNAYVCTMLELERLFESFTELMNKNYETVFEGYPSYPKFSMWRFMTKIWVKEIFEKSNFKLILNECFLRVLSNHREKNIKQALNTNFVNLANSAKYSELPKNLYVNLRIKRKKNSSMRYQSYEKLSNTPHICFGDVMDLEKRLLHNFIQSILDISLNEVKIHYLNCSDVSTNYPYRELEECFLMKSNEFYNDYQHLFQESPDYFCHFLKSDCSLLSDILTERTNFKLESVQIQNALQFMKNFIHQTLPKVDVDQLEEAKKTITFENHSNGLNEFIESIIQQVMEDAAIEEEKTCGDFYKLPSLELEEDLISCCEEKKGCSFSWSQSKTDKNFIKKVIAFFITICPDFVANFEYLKQRLEYLDSIKEKDAYIKEENTNKNIPYELGDVDSLFYDLDKEIDLNLLAKLYQDYQMFSKQQERENAENGINMEEEGLPDLELPGLNRQVDFMQLQQQQHNGIETGFFDGNEEFDLMDLANLPLRRV